MKLDVKKIYESIEDYIGKDVTVQGWVRNHRKQKEFGFIDFSDGTCFNHLQLVYDNTLDDFDDITKIKIGSSIEATGIIVKSEGKGQNVDFKVKSIKLLGDCPDDYPMQPKPHSREFLREQAYLRPRTNLFQAVFRIRSVAAHAIHTYFQDRNYIYVHTPIFTASDCEGAGQMFQATTLDLDRVAKSGKVEYDKDLFGKRVGLTVSGQLEGETFAMAFKNIYTFGPTFRAENSNTKIHCCEFWQIEPEIAFCDLEGLMKIEEEMLKFVIKTVLDKCSDEMGFLDKYVENGLVNKLKDFLSSTSAKVTHKEAIEILQKSGKKWEFEPIQGQDIAKEHEKYLTEEYFKSPVFVTNWPKDIKSFYMKQNPDGETVAAVDYLLPLCGELMGGSQREENLEKITDRMKELNMKMDDLYWYLNLRKYGGCIHSGFGMGFERLLIYLTGVDNIRDVIPYPRTPNNCEF